MNSFDVVSFVKLYYLKTKHHITIIIYFQYLTFFFLSCIKMKVLMLLVFRNLAIQLTSF